LRGLLTPAHRRRRREIASHGEQKVTSTEQRQRKILLVEPPFYSLFKETYSLVRYPLSLGYLAGEIRAKTDWGVTVYNADFRPRWEMMNVSYAMGTGFQNYLDNLNDPGRPIWRQVEAAIAACSPTVVGISAKSQNFKSALAVARRAKAFDPRTTVVVGGPHPSMVGEAVLAHPEIDIAVLREGERTLVELLEALGAGRPLDGVRGIVYRSDGRVVRTPPRELIENLDSLGFPHRHAPDVLKDYELYPIEAFANVFTTRGCPYQCFFCGSREIWTRKVRFRSPDNVTAEMTALRELGLNRVRFDDDTFGVNKGHIDALCGAILRDCPGMEWTCEIHVRLVDEPTIARMKAAGCRWIQLGVESGNNSILDQIRKGFTIDEALDACRIIKEHGIGLEVFFIVGFPQDTEETLADTVAAMRKIKCDKIAYSIFTPYPGTEAFEFCKDHGLIGDDFDISLYNHQSPLNSFCMNIPRDRFTVLARDIGKMVSRRNWAKRLRAVPSLNNLKRIPDLGLGQSLTKGFNALLGR
jgi:anaerobic magnesium-protoporphyrin IX monomethyl ester cyclase